MATLNIYLTFNGNCEKAFNYYKSVFGGEFDHLGRFSEMPENEDYKVPEEDRDKIMHVSLTIGKSVLMGSDTSGEYAGKFRQGNNFSISISTNSKEDTEKLFNALAKEGQITMPLDHTFWGDYFGTLTDKFGINWMFSFNEQHQK